MKILIQNYINSTSSRPVYFHHCLNSIEGTSSILWDTQKISVYDMLDGFSPDLILINYQAISNDLIRYVTSEKKIDIIVDISNMSNHHIGHLEDVIDKSNMPVKALISEKPKNLQKVKSKLKTINIPAGHDIFIGKNNIPDFKLDGCVIGRIDTKSFQDACSRYETYHKVLLRDAKGQGNREGFDIDSNVISLTSMYEKYGEITINGDLEYIFSQVFFDALAHCNKFSLKYPEEESQLFIDTISQIFIEEDGEPSIENMKKQIMNNHTCVDRCADFLLSIDDSDNAKAVLELKDK